MHIDVARCWDGRSLPGHAHARLSLQLRREALLVSLDAPHFGDAPPQAAPGSVEGLWEYEVVELFLGGGGDAYLELEFGPGGHYLVLELDAVRSVRRRGLPLDYHVTECSAPRAGMPGRYRAEARVPVDYLPRGLCRGNAFLIHGAPAARCHHAHGPLPGEVPDFHQPRAFVPIDL